MDQETAFGRLLREKRTAAGLTQEELAERSGLSTRAISDLERGVNRTARKDTLELLVEALQLSGDDRERFEAVGQGRALANASETVQAARLPIPPTPLVGREQELAWLLEAIGRDDVRLITLTGPGGTGKTRLALQAAADLSERYPDGVVFVSLASIINHGLVPSAVAQALDVRESSDLSLLDAIIRYLQGRRLLLVLDNFEQVVEAAMCVAELLAGCPALDILVTSRVRLRVRGEQEYRVAPLPLPNGGKQESLEAIQRSDAVILFSERARDLNPGFEINRDNAETIAKICTRLDGLPLAIELAAARTKLLPPQAMLRRLEQRLPLLTGGARDLPDRQQTLRDTVAWSYDLLTGDEQKLYRRLAVFRGGWTLDAAEAVAGSPATGEVDIDVFEGLSALIDHNIVRQAEDHVGEPRFSMLETIREYGMERLEESGEAAEARERYARYYVDLAGRVEQELTGSAQQVWLARLEAEHDNLRASLAWSLEDRSRTDLGLRLATGIWRFWSWHGHLREGRNWIGQLLDRCEEDGVGVSKALEAKGVNAAGVLDLFLGNLEQALTLHQTCLRLARDLGDEELAARSLGNLGVTAHKLGRYDEAATWHDEVLTLAQRRADTWMTALALHNSGVTLFAVGDWEEAARRSEESLALSRELGNETNVAKALMNLAQIAMQAGDYAQAEARLDESLRLSGQLGNDLDTAHALWIRGEIVRRQGETGRAASLFKESLALFRQHGANDNLAQCFEGLGQAAYHLGQYEQAARLLCVASELRDRYKSPLLPSYQPDYERALVGVRDALGEDTFESLRASAETMSREDSIEYALDWEPAQDVVADAGLPDGKPDSPAGRYGITSRELEVINLLVQGLSNQEIADQLFITRRTATTHVSNILNKLGLDSRTAIVAWAVREGVV